MKCKLCKRERKLCNSHIIPEFLYKPLYDSKHRFQRISTDRKENNIYLQKGIRERLLCVDCENRISVWEQYAQNIFIKIFENNVFKDKQSYNLINIKYKLFKLFQLSLLWRISITSIRPFGKISIGPHEEIIRKMILNNDPGNFYNYGCIMTILFEEDNSTRGLIVSPLSKNIQSHNSIVIIIYSIIWIFVVSSHTNQFESKNLFLSESGMLPLYVVKAFDNSMIQRLVKELFKSGNLTN